MKMTFHQTETAKKHAGIPETLNQRRCYCVGFEAKADITTNSPTQFLQTQKNQIIDWLEQFERLFNKIPDWGSTAQGTISTLSTVT